MRFKLLILVSIFSFHSFGQKLNFFDPSPTLSKPRLHLIEIVGGSLYVGSMFGLYELWYKDHPQEKFHLFNDNAEWMQMDKGGHIVVAYYVGGIGINVLNWAGVRRNDAIWYGGMMGFVYNTTFEVMDGFSSEYGFSLGDVGANLLGSAIVIGEQLAWNEQRIKLKFSYHHSPEASLRPDLLGSTLPQNAFKDYNGLSDWVSINVNSFMNRKTVVPNWLNIAAGYGADGMLGARMNPVTHNGKELPKFKRHRQYYISLDIDLSQINTGNKGVNTVLDVLNLVKIMAPALEYNKVTDFLFHPIYF